MKFKRKHEHNARDKTIGEEVTTRWQELVFVYNNAHGVWKEVKK